MLTNVSNWIKKFYTNNYLLITLIASVAISFAVVLLLFDITPPKSSASDAEKIAAQKEEAMFFAFFVVGVVVGILFTWPSWFSRKWKEMVDRAVGPLGGSNEKPNRDFEKRASSAFGPEFVSNIFSYEDYCKNEYIQDMRKHYVAWIQLAVSGLITVGAAILVIFRGAEANVKWIEAVGVTLPALVTGVLLKIWLETRENLDRTRRRTDIIYRQRIRLLLLIGNHAKGSKLTDSIELNRQILDYMNLSERPEDSQDNSPAAAT